MAIRMDTFLSGWNRRVLALCKARERRAALCLSLFREGRTKHDMPGGVSLGMPMTCGPDEILGQNPTEFFNYSTNRRRVCLAVGRAEV